MTPPGKERVETVKMVPLKVAETNLGTDENIFLAFLRVVVEKKCLNYLVL